MKRHLKHSHFWIEDEELYETYDTATGIRYILICPVPGLPDTENCPEDMLLYISKEFFD
jgi:hypothetical protein